MIELILTQHRLHTRPLEGAYTCPVTRPHHILVRAAHCPNLRGGRGEIPGRIGPFLPSCYVTLDELLNPGSWFPMHKIRTVIHIPIFQLRGEAQEPETWPGALPQGGRHLLGPTAARPPPQSPGP